MKFSYHVHPITSVILTAESSQQGNPKISKTKFYCGGIKISPKSIPKGWILCQVIRSPSLGKAGEDSKIPNVPDDFALGDFFLSQGDAEMTALFSLFSFSWCSQFKIAVRRGLALFVSKWDIAKVLDGLRIVLENYSQSLRVVGQRKRNCETSSI
jgi:hypothetical protein